MRVVAAVVLSFWRLALPVIARLAAMPGGLWRPTFGVWNRPPPDSASLPLPPRGAECLRGSVTCWETSCCGCTADDATSRLIRRSSPRCAPGATRGARAASSYDRVIALVGVAKTLDRHRPSSRGLSMSAYRKPFSTRPRGVSTVTTETPGASAMSARKVRALSFFGKHIRCQIGALTRQHPRRDTYTAWPGSPRGTWRCLCRCARRISSASRW